MKNLILTCMVLFLVFVFGCQESSITDPTQPLTKDENGAVNHNIIGLKYQLADPSMGGVCQLNGQVTYVNTILPSITDDGKIWVKVRLEMISQLCPQKESTLPPWRIEKKTEDKIFFTNNTDAVKFLHKTYKITNRRDVELFVTYSTTLRSVKVVKVFLRNRDE